jgi:two-component system response regulator AtoC
MRGGKDIVDRVAPTNASVLIRGESGSGNELVAQALHERSPRRDRPFVEVNCAGLPSELMESELFGYECGAFTGAHRKKPGKFEQAHSGTIFLNEIGEVPLSLQAKLFQVLRDRRFSRLGSDGDIKVNVRAIAATTRDLAQLAQSGRFRDDLFRRLKVVSIHVPPLRDRRDEIPALAEHFLQRYARQYGRPYRKVNAETMAHFLKYPWPGNVRELEYTIKRVVVLASEDWVTEDLACSADPAPLPASPSAPAVTHAASAPACPDGRPEPGDGGLKAIARRAALEAERAVLTVVLDQVHWNRLEASRRLKISYKTLRWKIRQCGLED